MFFISLNYVSQLLDQKRKKDYVSELDMHRRGYYDYVYVIVSINYDTN